MRQGGTRAVRTLAAPAAALLLLLPAVAWAAESWFLGEPWESGIVRGVADQRQALKRGTPPGTLVGRAERSARRDGSVVKLYLLARAYGVRANWNRERALKPRRPEDAARYRQLAQEDHASAIATYQEVLRAAPRCYFAHHDMGVMELQREKPVKRAAFDHLSQAYHRNRNYTPPMRQLINLYLGGKQYDVVIPLLQRLLQLEPDDDEARRRLAVAHAEMKQYTAAYREVDALIARSATNPTYMLLRAQLDLQTDRYERAIDTFKRLARLNPNIAVAFLGLLQAVTRQQAKKLPFDLTDMLFALKGLRRLERDPKRREELEREISRIEHRMAAPEANAPEGPPTTQQLLHALNSPEADHRVRALVFLMAREEKPTRAVLQAVAGHLAAASEPEPAVRAGAVRALGRLSGSALIPLIRLALSDADERVRVEAADTLTGIATRDAGVAGAVIAILGTQIRDGGVEVSASARQGILRLSGRVLSGLTDESDEAAHRSAFEAWWRGPEGESAQIDALAQYARLRDKWADQILVLYLSSTSFFVFRAAYRALAEAEAAAVGEAWKRWYGERPRFGEARLVKANWSDLRKAVFAWLERRPAPGPRSR